VTHLLFQEYFQYPELQQCNNFIEDFQQWFYTAVTTTSVPFISVVKTPVFHKITLKLCFLRP